MTRSIDKRDSRLVGVVNQYLYERHLTQAAAAKLIGISKNTFCTKMKQPQKFTVCELRNLCDVLRIPAAERTFL